MQLNGSGCKRNPLLSARKILRSHWCLIARGGEYPAVDRMHPQGFDKVTGRRWSSKPKIVECDEVEYESGRLGTSAGTGEEPKSGDGEGGAAC